MNRATFGRRVAAALSRADALAALRRLAAAGRELDVDAAAEKLLERIAARDDAAELRAALALFGAAAVVRDARTAQHTADGGRP